MLKRFFSICLFFATLNSYASERSFLVKVENKKILEKEEYKKLQTKYHLNQKKYYPSLKVVLVLTNVEGDLCLEMNKISGVLYCELDEKVVPQDTSLCIPQLFSMKLGGIEKIIEASTCPLLKLDQASLHEEEGLSPYWAQEYSGADLVREKLKLLKYENNNPNLIGVWDSAENGHGIKVGHLISGPHETSLIPSSKIPKVSDLNKTSDYLGEYEELAKCSKKNLCPNYINNSMKWPKGQVMGDLVANLSKKAVFITSSENDAQLVPENKRVAARADDAILVGSFSPSGLASDFSGYAPEVTISTAADYYITSHNGSSFVNFSGTSASVPQVTAALASFTLVTGYQLSTKEAKKLLEKTAMKFPFYPEENSLGKGMLNSYKIAEVALRLQQKCEKHKESCIREELKKEDTYLFQTEEKEIYDEGISLFPECENGNDPIIKADVCEEKKRVFTKIRQEAFLNPDNSKLWELVACVHKNQGMDQNAKFYEALSQRNLKTDEELLRKLIDEEEPYHFIRVLLTHPKWKDRGDFITPYLKDPDYTSDIVGLLGEEIWSDRTDWMETIINSIGMNATWDIVAGPLSKNHSKKDSKLIELIISKKNFRLVHRELAQSVLTQDKWLEHPELIEKLAKVGNADQEIALYILSSAKWQKVLKEHYQVDQNLSLEDLKH